ncbi:uncharacterized membrane protein YheB (UPF0754 family) [Bacillus oleivorans]|uniref:Uncharacterized membrane protein YheB (UPF0754 family) n=2 Tax=Bacillus oleivorans TaxID=1448271 RepID=A0A285CRE1_9BACI|nr:uncharacterized membrane protein YheB (UPF0754 family) [Bacillus oleivorans]
MLFLGLIGALIGGFTNFLAIKMLFRPYQPLYIGKIKIPFTPGLIPKRREELANQLGKLVVEQLITKDRIEKRLLNGSFKHEMIQFIQSEAGRWLKSEKTVLQVLEEWEIHHADERAARFLDTKVEEAYLKVLEKYGDYPLEQAIPEELKKDINQKIYSLTTYILEKCEDYFSSAEGKWRIQKMADEFLQNRGMFGNMLQMLLGNVNLVEKIQPEMIRFIQNEGTHDLLYSLFCHEWEKWQKNKISDAEKLVKRENIISLLQSAVRKSVSISVIFNKPVKELMAPYQEKLVDQLIPKVVEVGGNGVIANLELLLDKLQIDQLVVEQVQSFSLEKVEELVLSVAKSELKMITYLGALLGGFIGVVQSFVLLLF